MEKNHLAEQLSANNENFYMKSKFNATVMFIIGIGLSVFSYFAMDGLKDPIGFFALLLGITLIVLSFSTFLQGHYYARRGKYSAVSARIKRLRFS